MNDTIESELKHSSIAPEIILALVRDGVFVTDAKTGTFTYVNDAGCEMFGYSQRELIGRNIGFLSTGIPPYTQEDAVDWLKGGQGDAAKGFEWHCKTKGGGFFWSEISLRVVPYGDHQVVGLAIVRDITDRKLSSKLLHDSQAALVEAQAVAHVGSWQVDLVKNSVVWSEECYRIFNVDPATFIPTSDYFMAHIHPDDRDALTDTHARTLRDRSHGTLEQRIVLDDGAVRTVEQRWANFFDVDGKPLRTVGTIQDITARKIAESKLKQERDFSGALIDSLPGLFVVFDRLGRFVRCNDNMSALTGVPIEQLLGTDAFALIVESDRDLARIKMLEAFDVGVASVEFGVRSKAGDVRTILWNGRTIMNEGSCQLVAVGLDLTEMREIGERLQTSEERFRAVSQNALDAIIMINDAGEVTYWNPAAERILGYPVSEATGRNVHEWIAPPRFREKATAGLGRFATTGQGDVLGTTQDLAAIKKDGGEIPIEMSIASFRLGAKWQAVAFLRDVTVRKRMEQQMAHMAHHDILTGLDNRGVFVDMLNQAIAMSQRGGKLFAVLYLDLDHFKDVNDTLGHPAGDELLRSVARRLLAAVRTSDVVARFGGDEFALIATNLPEPKDAAKLADKILQALSVPIFIQGSEIRSEASIGIAVYGEDAPDAETLLAHADLALYRAKSEGRGTFRFFAASMDTEGTGEGDARRRTSRCVGPRPVLSCVPTPNRCRHWPRHRCGGDGSLAAS